MYPVKVHCKIRLNADGSPFATLGESKTLIRQAAWQFYYELRNFTVTSFDALEFSDPTDTELEILVGYTTLNFVLSGVVSNQIIDFFKRVYDNTGIDAHFSFTHVVGSAIDNQA